MRTVRLPVHVVRELNQVLRAKYHLEAQHHDGKEASAEDIASRQGSRLRPVDQLFTLRFAQFGHSMIASHIYWTTPTSIGYEMIGTVH